MSSVRFELDINGLRELMKSGPMQEALQEAGVTLEEITAIAVTYGPGLVGALLVGVSEAKAISFATGIPLIGVHHIEGHICANFIENKELEPWTIEERIATCKEYASRLVEYYGNELAACKEMRTHASWFLKGQSFQGCPLFQKQTQFYPKRYVPTACPKLCFQ